MALAGPATETFLAAIKPVGEKILLNFNLGATNGVNNNWNAAKTVAYDFVIQQNYVVTGLSVTKTVASLGDGDVLAVVVSKISNTGLIEEDIAAAIMLGAFGGGLKGSRVENGGFETGSSAEIYVNGSDTDPLTAVAANKKPVSGASNSQQKIRIRITAAEVDGTINPDCFVEVQLAKFIDSDQGASTSLRGVQLGELTTPILVA